MSLTPDGPTPERPGPATTEPVIELHAVSVGYGDRPTVNQVDLRVGRGEVVALVGPNGSGKTTLVRGILGLADILGGQIVLFDLPAKDFDDRWRIGYVPQRHTVVGAVPSTVHEVVGSGRLPRKRFWSRTDRDDRRAVGDAIERVGLTERRHALVSTLSGGQQRRVLIARALASEPEVMIMDEPTAGVDAESQQRLVTTLERLVDQGLTLLIVTHEITPLRRVLTRVVTLEDGRVAADVLLSRPPAERLPAHPSRAFALDAGHDPGHSAAGPHGESSDPLRTPTRGWLSSPQLGPAAGEQWHGPDSEG